MGDGVVENRSSPRARDEMKALIKERAREALDDSDLDQVFDLAGAGCANKTAGTAMKAVLAEKLTEYTMRAIKEAKKRGTALGAAAIIIAAQGR